MRAMHHAGWHDDCLTHAAQTSASQQGRCAAVYLHILTMVRCPLAAQLATMGALRMGSSNSRLEDYQEAPGGLWSPAPEQPSCLMVRRVKYLPETFSSGVAGRPPKMSGSL
jgi:hypothetical protein